jgi:hypothetical protein
MRNILSLVFILILILSFTGCVQETKPPIYYWGNYVESSSEYGMNGHNKEIFKKHLLELKNIINESESKQKRVAPGIYAEYAQMLFESNNQEKAKKYFILEKTTYPESTQFIDKVIRKLYGDMK